jgi:ankyrin repeat protein
MKYRRIRHSVTIFLVAMSTVFAVTIWMTYREIRREQLNRDLIAAVKNGNTESVIVLLKEGADANAREQIKDSRPVWRQFLDKLYHQPSLRGTGLTALLLYMEPRPDQGGHDGVFVPENETIIKVLLDHGADIDATDKQGRSSLMLAASNNWSDTTKLLLERHANVNLRGSQGETALHYADRNPDIIQALLNRGANIDSQDKYGETVLMLAVGARLRSTVQVLLKRQPNLALKNILGEDALAIAKQDKDPAIADMLKRGRTISSGLLSICLLLCAALLEQTYYVRLTCILCQVQGSFAILSSYGDVRALIQ